MKKKEILEMDFYDFCGSACLFMSDKDKIKWYRENIHLLKQITQNR